MKILKKYELQPYHYIIFDMVGFFIASFVVLAILNFMAALIRMG